MSASLHVATHGWRGTKAAGEEHKGPTERSQAGVRHDQGPLTRGAQRRAVEKPDGKGT